MVHGVGLMRTSSHTHAPCQGALREGEPRELLQQQGRPRHGQQGNGLLLWTGGQGAGSLGLRGHLSGRLTSACPS